MSFSLFAELMPEMQAAVHAACDPLSFMLMGMTCQAAAARLLARPQPHAFLGTHMVEEGAPISVVRWFACIISPRQARHVFAVFACTICLSWPCVAISRSWPGSSCS